MDNWSPWSPAPGGEPGPGSDWHAPRPERNFWGDIDGDGRETRWDDVLGDAIMADALAAQERRRRGLPPEPDDEDLIGPAEPYRPASRAGDGGATVAWLVLAALALCGCLAIGLSSY
jgi:hypothetical protein